MSYVESNLIPGEQVLYKTGLHWIVFFWPVFFAAFFGLWGLPLLFMRDSAIVGFFLLVFAGLLVLLGYLTRKATEMAVTNKRIVIKSGLLSRRTFELLLSKVESIGKVAHAGFHTAAHTTNRRVLVFPARNTKLSCMHESGSFDGERR